MAVRDPTAWKDDLEFYMSESAVEDQVSAIEPLLETGSRGATAACVAIVGTCGGAFGAVTISPAIRNPVAFSAYVLVAALLLRGLYPLIVRMLGKGAGWLAMFAFFWTSLLGLGVVVAAGFEARWLAYGFSLGAGAFIGMMYGAFPPEVARKDDPWMLAFLFAPVGAFVATYFLRHSGMLGTIGGAAAAGALAAGLLMGPMAVLLVRLWDEAQSLADIAQLYLHNDTFAPKAVAYLDRAIALDPDVATYYNLRATAWSRMNDAERAEGDWATAMRLSANDPEPHVQRGVHYLRRGMPDAAMDSFESALTRNPKHARALSCLGTVWQQRQDLERAFEYYDRAVALAPDDAIIRCDRSRALLRRGEHTAALKDANRAVRLQQHLGATHAARGEVLMMVGRVDEAVDSLNDAIECGLDPRMHETVLRMLESVGGAREGLD